jgi:hypothetical protein
LRIVGWCFIALALYILYESGSSLIGHKTPERSLPGIIVAAAAVIVMPLLARAKRKVAVGIGSGAMTADSKQADFCTYLSAILLSTVQGLLRRRLSPQAHSTNPSAPFCCALWFQTTPHDGGGSQRLWRAAPVPIAGGPLRAFFFI